MIIPFSFYSCKDENAGNTCIIDHVLPDSVLSMIPNYEIGDTLSFVQTSNGAILDTIHYVHTGKSPMHLSNSYWNGSDKCYYMDWIYHSIRFEFEDINKTSIFWIEYVSDTRPWANTVLSGEIIIRLDSVYLLSSIYSNAERFRIGTGTRNFIDSISLQGNSYLNVWSNFLHYDRIYRGAYNGPRFGNLERWDAYFTRNHGVIRFFSEKQSLELLP
jgi:hypothetical protein